MVINKFSLKIVQELYRNIYFRSHFPVKTRLERSASTEDEDGENTVVQNRSSGMEQTSDIGFSETQLVLGPEILHKSSKELYKAVAKQCGLTCKMSDHCRCFDCQVSFKESNYLFLWVNEKFWKKKVTN